MTRLLFLAHRYLGIALGVLMVMWCVSGIVMIYVPYPSLEDSARFSGLNPVGAAPCCIMEGEYFPEDDTAIQSFEAETLNGHVILTARSDGDRTYMMDISVGASFLGVSPEEAARIAQGFARGPEGAAEIALLGEVDTDQWTTGRFAIDRPLYHFALNDGAGSEIYVSSSSGRVVQYTNSHIRFWNWLGSVPHWLYFTQLRDNPQSWSKIVIWTSLIGCVLTVIGIYIGIRQLRRRNSDGKLASPYRGLWYWHHVPGLVFGVFTLTWVFSGLLSMNPWGFLGNSDPSPALARLYGGPPEWRDLKTIIPSLIAGAPSDTVHIRFAPFGGDVFAMASNAAGDETRLSASGFAAPFGEGDYARAAALIGEGYESAEWELLSEEDAYYYGRASTPPPLPVLRVTATGDGLAYYYASPQSGRLMRYADAEGRWYRWLFSGLHSLDFTSALRWRPFWDAMMIVLLLGATAVCATGTWLGVKRLLGKSRGQGFLVSRPRG